MEDVKSIIEGLYHADDMTRRNASEDLGYSGSEDAIIPLVQMLKDPSRAVSEAAADSLVMLGSEAVAQAVGPLLDNENPLLRNYALEILSQLGESAVPVLLEALDNDDHDIRKFAIDALSRINSPKSVPQLIESLEDPDVNISSTAAEALGRLGGEKVIPQLVGHLRDSPWMSGACLRALGEIGSSKAQKIILEQISTQDEPLLLLGAVQALAKIGNTQSIVPLIGLLRRQPELFSEEIIIALETIIEQHREEDVTDDLKDISLEPLYLSAKEGALHTRVKAIELIGELHQSFAIFFLSQLFYDVEGEIRKAAFHATRLLEPDDITPIIKILKDPEAPIYAQANALHALGCWKHPEGHSIILQFLNHEHLTLQRVSIGALYPPISEENIQQLRIKLASPDSEIRSHALDAIARLHLKSMLNDVIEALHDSDREVRKSGDEAFIALTYDEDRSKVHPFLNSMDQDERRVAFEYFSTHIDKSIEPQLIRGLQDANWEIRKIAIKVLVNTDPEKAAQLIVHCFEDQHPEVIVTAIHAYGDLKGESCRIFLEEYLQRSSNPRFIYETLTTLGNIGSPQSISAIEPYLHHSNAYWKLAAIESLKTIGNDLAFEMLRQIYQKEEDNEILDVLEDVLDSFS